LASPDEKPFYPLDLKVHLIRLNQTQNESSFLTRLGNILRRVFCLRRTLKCIKPDGVLSFVDVMNLTTLLASVGLKTPVIVSERTHPFSRARQPVKALSSADQKRLERKIAQEVILLTASVNQKGAFSAP
jgi:UDP-N-acetylglucosamine:LPS N-acetylglucosamine transferase